VLRLSLLLCPVGVPRYQRRHDDDASAEEGFWLMPEKDRREAKLPPRANEKCEKEMVTVQNRQ
jgi:hypothetical protein